MRQNITYNFISDLMNDRMSHENNYSTRDIQFLLYSELYPFDDFKKCLVSNGAIKEYIKSINDIFDNPTEKLAEFIRKYRDIKLAPPIKDADNNYRNVFIIDGVYKTSDLTHLNYCLTNKKYYTSYQNKKLFVGHKYFVYWSAYLCHNCVVDVVYTRRGGIFKPLILDVYYDVTNISNFDLEQTRKLLSTNITLFEKLYKEYKV